MPASTRFTIGIEEEFQIVDQRTGQLSPQIYTILNKGTPMFGERIKPEMLQSTIEVISDVLPDIAAARAEMQQLRAQVAQLAHAEGLALISAGTHPSALWVNEKRSLSERYEEIEEEYQDVARAVSIFGLHVHIGIDDSDLAISLVNQLRTWLPHLLALSANSPFWCGRFTGIKSYRSVVWKSFPRSGISDTFSSWNDFDRYVQNLVKMGSIDNGKKIWWDVRPHVFLNTIEFRVFDMPATFEDMIALAALCQALVARLGWLYRHNMATHILPRHFIEENKWRAMRYGLDAEVIDFVQGRRLNMREAICELLDFVGEVADDLGSGHEMQHLRSLLTDPRGTGADRQIEVYQQTGSLSAVIEFLMRQTMEGIMEVNNITR
ncbi:MAG TPA: carboxylate-amine ligase [Ktedonobacteraceae bacterium]|jgi:carboxylate-amine ligase|nr:carboxylate-amine ligase [Ktedonobacteraceae bacterium]